MPHLFPIQNQLEKGLGVKMDFLGQTWVMVTMGLALVGLIVLMVFLRMKPKDDDDE